MDYKEVLKELDDLRDKILVCIRLERDRLQEKAKEVAFNNHKDILYICSRIGMVSVEDICSPTRIKEVVQIRQIYCYLMYKNTGLSLKDIGEIVGRDHATIIYMRDSIKHEIKSYYKNGYDPRGTVGILKAIQEISDLQY